MGLMKGNQDAPLVPRSQSRDVIVGGSVGDSRGFVRLPEMGKVSARRVACVASVEARVVDVDLLRVEVRICPDVHIPIALHWPIGALLIARINETGDRLAGCFHRLSEPRQEDCPLLLLVQVRRHQEHRGCLRSRILSMVDVKCWGSNIRLAANWGRPNATNFDRSALIPIHSALTYRSRDEPCEHHCARSDAKGAGTEGVRSSAAFSVAERYLAPISR